MKVKNFNKTRPPPDVQKEEWTACTSPENFGQNEIGYRQLGDKVYDFLEKQVSSLCIEKTKILVLYTFSI